MCGCHVVERAIECIRRDELVADGRSGYVGVGVMFELVPPNYYIPAVSER